MARLQQATEHLQPPFAVIDLAALERNADDLARRAAGLPIRLASKSIRCRAILDQIAARPGFSGIMAYSLAEAVWLAGLGHGDILLAYPTTDVERLRQVGNDPELAERITIMIDCIAHLDLIGRCRGTATFRVAIDVDSSLRIGRLHLGVRRSPVHTAAQAHLLASQVFRRTGIELVGLMFYDAQIAGLPDSSALIRMIKRVSAAELGKRRSAVIDAVRGLGRLTIINGGGTGSLHVAGRDHALTELAAGSGLFGPRLFDGYRDFRPTPAAFFVLPVVRKPAEGLATTFSGGFIASGPPTADRQPQPWFPRGLRLLPAEGAGEVQTPLRGAATASLRVGDRVWFRHGKAGELCERFNALHVVDGDRIAATVPSYRGEGMNFG